MASTVRFVGPLRKLDCHGHGAVGFGICRQDVRFGKVSTASAMNMDTLASAFVGVHSSGPVALALLHLPQLLALTETTR